MPIHFDKRRLSFIRTSKVRWRSTVGDSGSPDSCRRLSPSRPSLSGSHPKPSTRSRITSGTASSAERYRKLLERAVLARENILVAGAMGSGKSTLLNALLAIIPSHERVGILEDVFELSAPHLPNKNHLHTTSEVSLRMLTRMALRLQLDRIIVGETRGAEALDMLKAWRVGCNGSMATIHSNSAAAALTRLGSLVQEAGVPPQDQLIAEAVQLIVFIEARQEDGRLQKKGDGGGACSWTHFERRFLSHRGVKRAPVLVVGGDHRGAIRPAPLVHRKPHAQLSAEGDLLSNASPV